MLNYCMRGISPTHSVSEEVEAGPGGQHGGEDGSLQLPSGIELPQASYGLLSVEGGGKTLSLLQGGREGEKERRRERGGGRREGR